WREVSCRTAIAAPLSSPRGQARPASLPVGGSGQDRPALGFARQGQLFLGHRRESLAGHVRAARLRQCRARTSQSGRGHPATGREKIVSRYQSYPGATYGAMAATGDNRRVFSEPHLPAGFVKTLDPYRYRCPFCTQAESCTLACADAVEATVLGEGPETVAAIL